MLTIWRIGLYVMKVDSFSFILFIVVSYCFDPFLWLCFFYIFLMFAIITL